jgi:glucose/mannose transport system substrate-binding protein
MKYTPHLLLLSSSLMSLPLCAAEVEVLHWWTSGGEARSINVLKEMMESQGYVWKNFAVNGGGGESAMTVLASRVFSGNSPSAAQIKAYDIKDWARLGFLANIDDVAKAGHWDAILPPMIAAEVKWDGKYVAAPINIHRSNWLWANTKVFEENGLRIPHTLEEFYAVGDRLKQLGIIPLAHGSQPWQDATLFDAIALGVLGADDYIKAFVQLDMDTLSGPKMVKVFTHFKRIHNYIDVDAPGRDWNVATKLLIDGKAAMQVMGDWVKGDFSLAGKVAGVDYECVPAFGTEGQFTYNVDNFAFFQLTDPLDIAAQNALAATVLSVEFQEKFNQSKGSIPVRLDMDMSKFDRCALDAYNAFKQAVKSGTLVPSVAHGMATTSYAQGAIYDVVTNFFNDPNSDPQIAPKRLANAIRSSM